MSSQQADLADDGALDEAAEDDQQRRQHREELQVAGRVLPPVEVAARPHTISLTIDKYFDCTTSAVRLQKQSGRACTGTS